MMTNEKFDLKRTYQELNSSLSKYSNLIGIAILIALLFLIYTQIQTHQKQDQIRETCGYVQGDIKCVCEKSFVDQWEDKKIDLDNITIAEGIGGG